MNIEDLYTVDNHEAGAEMQVRDGNGKLVDMFITLVGIDSKLWRKEFNKAKRSLIQNKNDTDDIKAKTLANSTIGWRGFLNKGKELKFSVKSVYLLYKNAPYITDQVDEFIANRVNFIKS